VPSRLNALLDYPDYEASLLLIFLARIEDSIISSYMKSKKESEIELEGPGIEAFPSSHLRFNSHEHLHYMSFLSDVYKSWIQLQKKDMLQTSISSPKLPIDAILVRDLLFVPLVKITAIHSFAPDQKLRRDDKVLHFISNWSNIIHLANQLTISMHSPSTFVHDHEVVELFADDALKNKPAMSKKKKKKVSISSFYHVSIKCYTNVSFVTEAEK
jgi:hypothetical protein